MGYAQTVAKATSKHGQHLSLEYKDTDCTKCYPQETDEQRAEWNRAVVGEMSAKYESPQAMAQERREALEDEESA